MVGVDVVVPFESTFTLPPVEVMVTLLSSEATAVRLALVIATATCTALGFFSSNRLPDAWLMLVAVAALVAPISTSRAPLMLVVPWMLVVADASASA